MNYDSLFKINQVSGQKSNWGSNKKKIIRDGEYVYTFVNYVHPDNPENLNITPNTDFNQVYLYFIVTKDGGSPVFSKDYYLALGNASLLVDSKRRLHAFYYKPDTLDANNINTNKGKIVHLVFPTPGNLDTYEQEDLTPGWESNDATEQTYSSFYFGAAIDEADRILVVYENTIGGGGIKDSYILACRYGLPSGEGYQWRYQRVAELKTRHCYPSVIASPDGWYVCAVQDQNTSSGKYQFDELRILFAPANAVHQNKPVRSKIKAKIQDIAQRLKADPVSHQSEAIGEEITEEFPEEELVWEIAKTFDGSEGYFGFTFYGDLLLDQDRKTVLLVFVYGYYDYGPNLPSYNNQTYECWSGVKDGWVKQWHVPETENYQPVKGNGEIRPVHPWRGTNMIRFKRNGNILYYLCCSWSELYAYKSVIDESNVMQIYSYAEAKKQNEQSGNPGEPEIQGYNLFVDGWASDAKEATDLIVYGNSSIEPEIAMLMKIKLD